MSGFRERGGVERMVVIWLLLATLLVVRLTLASWVWFCVFVAVYALLAFALLGALLPAAIAALGCAISVWLHMYLYRQLTIAEGI